MRRAAFTLVEVLVVCAIIVIIAALFTTAFLAAKGAAKNTTCISNLKSIGQALHLYAGDHAEYIPPYLIYGGGLIGDPVQFIPARPREWRDSLLPYTGSKEIFYCPLDLVRGPKKGPGIVQWDSTFTSFNTIGYGYGQDRFGPGNSYRVSMSHLNEDASRIAYLVDLFFRVPITDPNENPYVTLHGAQSNNLFLDGHVRTIPQD